MQIGLSGIPGSGKSLLAIKLKEALIEQNLYETVDIVDNYTKEIEQTVDLAIGPETTYIGNVHVALGREARERISRETHDFSIVCGTLFETSAYTAQKMESDFRLVHQDAGEKYDWQIRTDAVMRYIACLYIDTVYYDKIYHLLPLSTDLGHNFSLLEKNLQAAFNAFDLYPVKHLEVVGEGLEEITEHRVQEIIKDITNANNTEEQNLQTEESNGSGV